MGGGAAPLPPKEIDGQIFCVAPILPAGEKMRDGACAFAFRQVARWG